MSYEKGDDLESFNDELAALNMRGQWLSDDRRDHGTGGAWKGDVWESTPRGDAHIWSWKDTEPLLEKSCDAIPESFTARRSLVFSNPGLERSTTHTMNVGIQLIKPGELAWAHRHTISALRFVIEGHKDLYTVVDGAVCPMADNDLILTPNWQWHDHHNQSDGRALWLDVLDGTASTGNTGCQRQVTALGSDIDTKCPGNIYASTCYCLRRVLWPYFFRDSGLSQLRADHVF